MSKLFVFMVGCAWLGARDTLLFSLCLLKGTGTEYSMKKIVGQAKDCEIPYPLLPEEKS